MQDPGTCANRSGAWPIPWKGINVDQVTSADRARHRQTGRPLRTPETRSSPTALLRDVGPCVYFIRTSDNLIKIGYTSNLADRYAHYDRGLRGILAIQSGTLADERALHWRFRAYLAKGREYFKPAPELLGHIDTLRAALGVNPIRK